MREPNFLVVRLGSLGDIVHTMPAVAGLRESFPSAGITWLTHPRWKLLVESSGLASEIWATETRSLSSLRKIIGEIRRSHVTDAVDYQGLWKAAGLPFFGGVKRRIGFSAKTIREWGVPVLYTDRVKCVSQHIADQNGELSARAGARSGVAPFTLRVRPQDCSYVRTLLDRNAVRDYIVLSPGGGGRSKCWPAERFGALCRMIRQSFGLRCIVNYGPGEGDLAEALKAAAGESDPLLWNEDLGPLMALLQNARCVVGGDTGPLHLAIALGTPAVGIYGPTDPARNGPYNSRDIVLRTANAVRDHTRHHETDPSMLAITVDEVFQTLQRRLGAAA